MFDKAQIIDENRNGLDELLNRQVFAALLVIIEEAISNKEVNLGEEPTAIGVSPLLLLRDDTAIFIDRLTVLLIKHVEVSQSGLGPSNSIQNLVNRCLRLTISDFFELCLKDVDGELHIAKTDLLIINFLLFLLLSGFNWIVCRLPSSIRLFLVLRLVRALLSILTLLRLLGLVLLKIGVAIVIHLGYMIEIFFGLLVHVVGDCARVENIQIFLQLGDDEVAILIVKDSHGVGGLSERVFGLEHEVVKLFLDLIRRHLLDYAQVGL